MLPSEAFGGTHVDRDPNPRGIGDHSTAARYQREISKKWQDVPNVRIVGIGLRFSIRPASDRFTCQFIAGVN